MKKLNLSEIPALLKINDASLEYDSDKRIHIDLQSAVTYWDAKTEKEYNKIASKIDKLSIKGKGYEIYGWYDVSGFHYWSGANEPNYLQLTIGFDDDTINSGQLKALKNKIYQAIDKSQRIIENNLAY